jgi:hypothetical protein
LDSLSFLYCEFRQPNEDFKAKNAFCFLRNYIILGDRAGGSKIEQVPQNLGVAMLEPPEAVRSFNFVVDNAIQQY